MHSLSRVLPGWTRNFAVLHPGEDEIFDKTFARSTTRQADPREEDSLPNDSHSRGDERDFHSELSPYASHISFALDCRSIGEVHVDRNVELDSVLSVVPLHQLHHRPHRLQRVQRSIPTTVVLLPVWTV